MEKHDITKLPKWAQEKIRVLEMRVEEMLQERAIGPENSDTFIIHYGDEDTPLGKGTRIRFQLGKEYYDRLEVSISRRGLEVYGSECLKVRPQASNVVTIVPELP